MHGVKTPQRWMGLLDPAVNRRAMHNPAFQCRAPEPNMFSPALQCRGPEPLYQSFYLNSSPAKGKSPKGDGV